MASPFMKKRLSGILIISALSLGVILISVYMSARILEDDLKRTSMNFFSIFSTLVEAPFGEEEKAFLSAMLSAPEICGLEVFSENGRRIWSVGEPLELIAYRLNRDTELTHQAEEGARFEIFWPAARLESSFGLALRLDTAWHRVARREVLILAGLAALFGVCAAIFLRTARFWPRGSVHSPGGGAEISRHGRPRTAVREEDQERPPS